MKKIIMSAVIATILVINGSGVLASANTDVYRENDLKSAGFDSAKIEEFKKVYSEINSKSRSSNEDIVDYNTFVDEMIRGMSLAKKDAKLKVVVPKNSKARATVSELKAPGDIIIEHKWGNESTFIGHTATIGTNTDYVWEINGYRQVVRSNSISRYMDDLTTPQSWNYVPDAYKNNPGAQTSAGKWPARVVGAPYSLSIGKDSISAFYCSKLSWKSWFNQGYDLDNDGGTMVLPMDIYWDNDVMPYYQQNI